MRAALKHANGAKLSDNQIAEHVGVSHATVIKYRKELETTCQIDKSPARTGRDGRTIDTSNIGKAKKKEARNRRIFDLWMACWTQEEIARDTGIDQGDLSKMTKTFMEIGNLAKIHKSAAEHATDFDPPIYNVWKQQEKTGGSEIPIDRTGGIQGPCPPQGDLRGAAPGDEARGDWPRKAKRKEWTR